MNATPRLHQSFREKLGGESNHQVKAGSNLPVSKGFSIDLPRKKTADWRVEAATQFDARLLGAPDLCQVGSQPT